MRLEMVLLEHVIAAQPNIKQRGNTQTPLILFRAFSALGFSENVSLKTEVLFLFRASRLKIPVSLLRLFRLDVIWMYSGVFESLAGTPRLGKCSRIWIFAAQNTRAADSEPVFPPLSAVFVSRSAHSA